MIGVFEGARRGDALGCFPVLGAQRGGVTGPATKPQVNRRSAGRGVSGQATKGVKGRGGGHKERVMRGPPTEPRSNSRPGGRGEGMGGSKEAVRKGG